MAVTNARRVRATVRRVAAVPMRIAIVVAVRIVIIAIGIVVRVVWCIAICILAGVATGTLLCECSRSAKRCRGNCGQGQGKQRGADIHRKILFLKPSKRNVPRSRPPCAPLSRPPLNTIMKESSCAGDIQAAHRERAMITELCWLKLVGAPQHSVQTQHSMEMSDLCRNTMKVAGGTSYFLRYVRYCT